MRAGLAILLFQTLHLTSRIAACALLSNVQSPRPAAFPVGRLLYLDICPVPLMDTSPATGGTDAPNAEMSAQPAPKDELRILCFGDSLTAGYMLTSPDHYPYGDFMQTELAKLLQRPLSKIHVDIDGFSGIPLQPLCPRPF